MSSVNVFPSLTVSKVTIKEGPSIAIFYKYPGHNTIIFLLFSIIEGKKGFFFSFSPWGPLTMLQQFWHSLFRFHILYILSLTIGIKQDFFILSLCFAYKMLNKMTGSFVKMITVHPACYSQMGKMLKICLSPSFLMLSNPTKANAFFLNTI